MCRYGAENVPAKAAGHVLCTRCNSRQDCIGACRAAVQSAPHALISDTNFLPRESEFLTLHSLESVQV